MRPLVYCLCSLVAVVLLSCNEDASQIGSGFFEGGSIGLATVDTLTIRTSTIRFDSLITSDATRFLVGYHNDEDLGIVSSSSYLQIGMQGSFSIDKLYTSYTRAELRLVHDGYSYYDTLDDVSLSVHSLTEDMEFQDQYIYNTKAFKYNATPLGSITYKAKPNTHDTVHIPLSEQFGRDIIRFAQGGAIEVSSTTEFLNYFRGIALVPSPGNGPVVGFSTDAEIRIYYLDKSQTPGVERYLVLNSGNNLWCNHIGSDMSSTQLNGLDDQRLSFGSDRTDKKGYIQSGAGLGLRIEIPYLRSMLIENEGLTIVNAVLEIAPARNNSSRNTPLPTELVMSAVDYKNQLISTYTTNATLNEDLYLDRDTHFEADITVFVKQQLQIEQLNNNALVFTTNDATFRSTVTRLYAGDQLNDREMKLKISCLTISK